MENSKLLKEYKGGKTGQFIRIEQEQLTKLFGPLSAQIQPFFTVYPVIPSYGLRSILLFVKEHESFYNRNGHGLLQAP